MKRLIVDLDDTICTTENGNYAEATVIEPVRERLREYKERGFTIVIQSSRNMRTYEGNIGKINAHTLPVIIAWLEANGIPHDEIVVGKPWCGFDGFYVDDRAVRADEFVEKSYDEIRLLLRSSTERVKSHLRKAG
jgi:capsule biosynthesis phosphatase